MTLTTIATGITSLIFFFSGRRVYSVYKKEKSSFAFFLSGFLLFFSAQQFFFFLGTGLLTLDPDINSILWAIAHVFMFAGISLFIRFPFRIRFPKLEKKAFAAAIIYSFFGSIFLFYSASDVVPRILDNNIFFFEVPATAGAVIGIFTSISLIFSLYVFTSEMLRLEKGSESRIKLSLLSLGSLFFFVGGPMHNFVEGPLMLVFADLMIILGALFLLAGVQAKTLIQKLRTIN